MIPQRPKLSKVSPQNFAICWGFVVVNVTLGLGMLFLYHTNIPLLVANILTYHQWGILFLSVGALSAFALLRNNWELSRGLLIAGILLKSVWALALIIRCISAPQTILLTAVWGFLLFIQAITYIYFLPNAILKTKGQKWT